MRLSRFVFLLLVSSAVGCSTTKVREVAFFDNDYHGIRLGRSTLDDVVSILGPYASVEETVNGHNYRFEKVIVNISGIDLVHVNTVTIDRDDAYVSRSGLKLGDSLERTKKNLRRAFRTSDTVYDMEQGIIYWYKEGVITKIVLMHRAYRW